MTCNQTPASLSLPATQALLPLGALEAAMAGGLSATCKPNRQRSKAGEAQAEHGLAQQQHVNHQQPSQPPASQSFFDNHAPSLPQLSPCDCFLHANGEPSWPLLQVKHA